MDTPDKQLIEQQPVSRTRRERRTGPRRGKRVAPYGDPNATRESQLEVENSTLKRLLADLVLENALLTDTLNETQQLD